MTDEREGIGSMTAIYFVAACLGLAGVLGLISAITIKQISNLPSTRGSGEEIDYLWWDEGHFWGVW